jgi:hypothetical protein
MNSKLELIIESILNEDEAQAKAMFHEFVVQRSREIYESLMDEDLGGDQQQEFVQSIQGEQQQADQQGLGEDDLEGGNIELGGGDDEFNDEETFGDDGEGLGGEEAEHEEIVSKLDDLEAQLAELKAMLGDEGEEDEFGGEEPAGDEFGGDEEGESDFDMDGETSGSGTSGSGKSSSGFGTSGSGSAEELEETWNFEKGSDKKGSGKSGSGASGSGASGSGKAASGKSGSGKTEGYVRKTEAEIMKEYVDKIGEVYKQEPAQGEGKTVGTGGDEPTVQKDSVSLSKGPNFGGSSKNLNNGGANENPDGKQFKKPTNEYSKKEGTLPHAGQFKNVPGNKNVWNQKGPSDGHGAEKKSSREGGNVGAKDTIGTNINKKGELGGQGQPTGKK